MRHRSQKSTTEPERRKERETFCVRFGKQNFTVRSFGLWARVQLHENDSQGESFFYIFRNSHFQIIHTVNDFFSMREKSRLEVESAVVLN